MKLEQFTERIYMMPGETRTDRPYLFYIRGDHASVAVDAGNSKDHLEEFYGQLSAMNLPLPAHTVLTHWHWDHTFGLSWRNMRI